MLRLVALASVLAMLGWTGCSRRHSNVVIVTLDTTRPDHLGPYGYEHADTPTLDALADQGVTYERAYAPVPLTLPSHVSLMTGLLPPRHGVHINGSDALDSRANTLAEILRHAGYSTGAVVGAFVLDARFGLAQGFDHYDDDLGSGVTPGPFSYAERNAAEVTDAAIAWWKRPRKAPALLWVHYYDSHAPYSAPGFDPALATRTPYDAEIEYVDAQLSRLLEAIDTSETDPALVVVTADHGEALFEHGEPTHGLFTYEATLRVPLIVRFPDRRHAGTRIAEPVALVDITPSILSWLGLEVPAKLDGRPLPVAPAREAAAQGQARRIYFESQNPARVFGWNPLHGMVVGDWKLIRSSHSELYDLRDDPHERENRFESNAGQAKALVRALDEALADFGAQASIASVPVEVTEEVAARLQALGYLPALSEFTSATMGRARPGRDPMHMLPTFRNILAAQSLIVEDRLLEAVTRLVDVLAEDPANPRALFILADLIDVEEARSRVIEALMEAPLEQLGGALAERLRHTLATALLAEDRPADGQH